MIEYFEKPIIKKAHEMKAGDVYRTEYGDDGNFINATFESCCAYGEKWTEICFHTESRPKSDTAYANEPIDKITFEVIGVEK